MVNSFKDIIVKLGGPAEFGRAVGMTPGAAKQAQRRNSIAAEWFAATARAAQSAGLAEITEARLAELAERKRTQAA
jgi:hypothetical protein